MFLKKLFAKPEKEAAPQAVKSGFFSTDISLIPSNSVSRGNTIANAIAKSIRITPKDMKVLDADGKAMDSAEVSGTGMDSKLGGAFAVNASNYGGVAEAQIMWYASQGFIGYQLCAIIAQHWLVDKACTLPARDAVRNGFELSVNDGTNVAPEVFQQIRDLNRKYRLVNNMRELLRQGRIFGIRHCLFHIETDDKEFYEKPFNLDSVKPGSYRGMSQIDPYWLAPVLSTEAASNPGVKDFYEPTWWILNGKRIHRSHFIIMITNEVPDVLKPSYFYGGVSVSQKIYERVYASERTANEAPMLAMTKRLNTLKMDITQALANEETFTQRMLQWAAMRDNYGVKIIGEGEEVDQKDTALGDLDNVIMTQYQLVAAIAEVPATKLMGTQPKGFNSTGEFEESSYHESLESYQEHDLTPLVSRHIQLVIRSDIQTKPFEFTVEWNPLDALTAMELADINLKKSQTFLNYANGGALDGTDERERLIGDPTSGYNGITSQAPEPDEEPDPAEEDKPIGGA